MTTQPIRIVQLTDLHFRGAIPGTSEIATRRSRHVGALLDRFEALLPELKPDFLAITGDLLHAPYGLYRGANPFAMEIFGDAVVADYRALKARFDKWGIPYLTMPGNHDEMGRFASVFDAPPETCINGYRIIAFHDREGPGNVPFRGTAERERLRASLSDTDPRPQIHLQHYVMHPQVEHPYPHNYGDSAELLGMLAQSDRVRLSLAGHFHPGSTPTPHGNTLHFIGRAVCEAPYPVTVIDIDEQGRVATREVHLAGAGNEAVPATHVAMVSRETFLPSGADPFDAGAVKVPAALTRLPAGALLIGTSDLGHPSLAGMGWPELADWHDRLHLVLSERGVVLDGLYYTSRHPSGDPAGAALPRIAIRPDQSLLDRVERDFGLVGHAYTTSSH